MHYVGRANLFRSYFGIPTCAYTCFLFSKNFFYCLFFAFFFYIIKILIFCWHFSSYFFVCFVDNLKMCATAWLWLPFSNTTTSSVEMKRMKWSTFMSNAMDFRNNPALMIPNCTSLVQYVAAHLLLQICVHFNNLHV